MKGEVYCHPLLETCYHTVSVVAITLVFVLILANGNENVETRVPLLHGVTDLFPSSQLASLLHIGHHAGFPYLGFRLRTHYTDLAPDATFGD